MGIMASIFTWWNGATLGTRLWSWRHGLEVGSDPLGNRYFQSRDGKRRWVLYNGSNDASRVPAAWHGWLHGSLADVPDHILPTPKPWQQDSLPNATGTPDAYRPQGSLYRGGVRAAATGDYEAWRPDAD